MLNTEEKILRIVGVAMQVAGFTWSLHFIVLQFQIVN